MDHTPHMPGWRVTGILFSDRAGTVYEICREHDPSVRATLKVISIPSSSAEIRKQLEKGCTEDALHNFYLEQGRNISEELELLRQMQENGAVTGCEELKVEAHPGGIGCRLLIRSPLLTPVSEYALTHPMSDDEIIHMGLDICDALMLCAKEQITHGAIEPGSIFVTADGHFKLGNFGAAKISDAGTDAYSYMAPEVYSRRPTHSSSDLYALGLVMYELLNGGCLPFSDVPTGQITAEQRSRALTQRISGTPVPRPVGGTNMLQEAVLTACPYDPEQRFSTAAALRGALLASRASAQSMPSAPVDVFDPVPTPWVYTTDQAPYMPKPEEYLSEPAAYIAPSEEKIDTPVSVVSSPEVSMPKTELYVPKSETSAKPMSTPAVCEPLTYEADENAPTIGPFSDPDYEAYDPYDTYSEEPYSTHGKASGKKGFTVLWISLIVLGVLILTVGGYLLWDTLSSGSVYDLPITLP